MAEHLSSEGYSFAVGGAVGKACPRYGKTHPGVAAYSVDAPHHGAGDAWPPRASVPYLAALVSVDPSGATTDVVEQQLGQKLETHPRQAEQGTSIK